jgi:DNA-binding MarR family transcriptional regulator
MKRAFKGLWIPAEIYLSEDLNMQEVFILAEVDSLDNGEGCFAKNEHFCKRMNIKERAVQNHIKSLQEKNYLEVVLNRKNNTRVIYSNLQLKVYEETTRKKMRRVAQNNAQADANKCVSTYRENKLENKLEKTNKKESSENHIVEPNEMVETESKIPSVFFSKEEVREENERIAKAQRDYCKEITENKKEFESMWRYFFDEYKKEGKPLGSKSEANKNFLKKLKTREIEEIKQSFYNYFHDCKMRGYGFMHLVSFLSSSKKYVEEWKNGSENHQALLELKNKPQKNQNNGSRFESKTERVERNVREQRESITSVLEGLPDDLFAPEPDQKLIN